MPFLTDISEKHIYEALKSLDIDGYEKIYRQAANFLSIKYHNDSKKLEENLNNLTNLYEYLCKNPTEFNMRQFAECIYGTKYEKSGFIRKVFNKLFDQNTDTKTLEGMKKDMTKINKKIENVERKIIKAKTSNAKLKLTYQLEEMNEMNQLLKGNFDVQVDLIKNRNKEFKLAIKEQNKLE